MLIDKKSYKRLTNIWIMARQRCRNPKATHYSYYGGRGIDMCQEWENKQNFIEWSLSNGYSEELTLDRINGDKNYKPSNCRWTTKAVQVRDTRLIRKTNTSGYRGVTYCKRDKKWIAQISVNYKNIMCGRFLDKKDAAIARDNYVIMHKLEHTLNFKK